MPEITELLDGTTPRDLAPVDVADLARRAHSRHRRQRRATIAACLAVVLAAAVTAVAAWPDSEPDFSTGETEIEIDGSIGQWNVLVHPALEPEAPVFATQLDDGRMFWWGGVLDNNPTGEPFWTVEGHTYDPQTEEWDVVQPDLGLFPRLPDYVVQVARNRLAVVPVDTEGNVIDGAAIYNFAERRWAAAPPLPEEAANLQFDVAWNGEVLALVLSEETDTPWQTLRWQLGETAWQPGNALGIDVGLQPGTDFDGRRLALWGGNPPQSFDAGGVIYDVADDKWQSLPTAPISGRVEPVVMWRDGQLLVGAGPRSSVPDDEVGGLAAYEEATDDWRLLRPAPDVEDIDPDSPPYRESGEHFVVSPAAGGSFEGADSWWFLDGDEWQPAPYQDLHEVGGLVVATNAGVGGQFRVAVRSTDGAWLAAADAPFDAADVTAVTVADDKLFVLADGGVAILDLAG